MPNWSSRVLLTALLVIAVAVGTRSAAAHDPAPRRATLATFARHWWGHTRAIDINKAGHATERIYSGCCISVIDYTFRLMRPRGTVTHGSMTFRVTSVRRWGGPMTRPRLGQLGELRLSHGVITDSLTRVTFCAPRVGKCGA